MFAFKPFTEAELNDLLNKQRGLLAEGIYPFIIREITQMQSQSNNEMLKLKLGVFDTDGTEKIIYDYLVATDRMGFKIKHFCESIGFDKEYAEGQFEPTKCLNKPGYVRVFIKKGDPKLDGSGFYPDRNAIKDYLRVETMDAPKQTVAKDSFKDDDITF